MTAVKSNIQKLEALLKSATNARQRQMYQSLLEKARQDALHQQSAPNFSQAADSKANVITTDSSTKKQKPSGIGTKKVLSETEDTLNPQTTNKANSGDRPVELKQAAPNRAKKMKSNQQSELDKPTIFQAVGLIRCMTQVKEDRLYITIDGQAYELKRGQRRSHKRFEELKREIEQNGSKELWLRVYPKVIHDAINEEIRYWFILVRAFDHKSQCRNQQEGFILRGIWQYIPYCCDPCDFHSSQHRDILYV